VSVNRPGSLRPVVFPVAIANPQFVIGNTPTRVYHYYSNGMSQPAGGLSTVALTINLARASLFANALVLWVAYDSGKSVSSVTDNLGQTWPAAAATVDGGAGNVKLSAFVLPNTAAGVQSITINLSAAAHLAVMFQEYYSIASTSPVVQTRTATPTGPTVATAAFASAPTAGNLVLHCGVSANGLVGNQSAHVATGFTAGTGFKLIGASRHVDTSNPWAVQERIADGNALTPSMTISQGTADTFCTIALELAAATVGTAPTETFRILKSQFFVFIATNTNFTENFPCEGNLIVLRTTTDGTSTLTTDSQTTTWVWDQQTGGLPRFQHGQPASVGDPAYTVTFKTHATQPNDSFFLLDIAGAAPSSVVGATANATGTTGSSDTEVVQSSLITPQSTNSLILTHTSIGHGPLTNLHSPTPAGAIFECSLYPEETDFDTLMNADGYALYFNGASTSAVSFAWRWNVNPGGTSWAVGSAEGWQAVAVEYKSA
jgi:hypothetical protein